MNANNETFELAADATVMGNIGVLAWLLRVEPDLINARSARAHAATLLHYISANGVEQFRQRTPPNIVPITRLLLGAGAAVNAVAEIYGKSAVLGLVASSVHPKKAGLQIALINLLLEHGANLDGGGFGSPLLAALRNGHGGAAVMLAERGARLTFEGACGTGRLEDVLRLESAAADDEWGAGFVWACQYGYPAVVDYLLSKDLDPASDGKTGLPGLHWAAVGGQVEVMRLLVSRGAKLDSRNRYGGTVLGQILWSAMNGDGQRDYLPVLQEAFSAGARLEGGEVDWVMGHPGPSRQQKVQLVSVLQSHGV